VRRSTDNLRQLALRDESSVFQQNTRIQHYDMAVAASEAQLLLFLMKYSYWHKQGLTIV
jgi:hypothetical protein